MLDYYTDALTCKQHLICFVELILTTGGSEGGRGIHAAKVSPLDASIVDKTFIPHRCFFNRNNIRQCPLGFPSSGENLRKNRLGFPSSGENSECALFTINISLISVYMWCCLYSFRPCTSTFLTPPLTPSIFSFFLFFFFLHYALLKKVQISKYSTT